MWRGVWLAISVSAVYSQYPNTRPYHALAPTRPHLTTINSNCTKFSQNGPTFGWGWRLTPTGTVEPTLGHYHVKLPQSEQQVRFSTNVAYGGVQSHPDIAHAQSITLGHSLHGINNLNAQNFYLSTPVNSTNYQAQMPNAPPVNAYQLQHQNPLYTQSEPSLQIPSTVPVNSDYNTRTYNTPPQGTYSRFVETARTTEANQRMNIGSYHLPLKVLHNNNCTNKKEELSKDLQNDMKKSRELFAEAYDFRDINNFAASFPQNYIYKGTVKYNVESPRSNSHTERGHHTTVETPTFENTTLDGIDKLVASTQDLISNDDLMYINDALEKQVYDQSEEVTPKPTSKSNKYHEKENKKHITVKAKIENIVDQIQHFENDRDKKPEQKFDSTTYTFARPIIVSDNSYDNIRGLIVDNFVSTIVPYMVNGYKLVDVKHTNQPFQDDIPVNVTPRPVNQNYLTPITVALRLINANDTEIYNTIEDPDASDSELISDTVKSPRKEKTIVEIQKSIPGDITHINAVEYHDYLDIENGRSNNRQHYDEKSLYNKYVDALKTRNILDNVNKLLNQHSAHPGTTDNNAENNSAELEPSENIRSEVGVSPNFQYYTYFGKDNQKLVQPIIIEKEIPVTKFVDRFIEKKVLYPQHIKVEVPVDRPYPVEVPVEKIVEKPVEVTKYIDKPYPVEVPRPYPVEIKVPYPVEQNVYIDRPVHVPYPVEKVVEKQVLHPVPVPTPVGIPIGVPYPVEHQVLYPVPVDRPVPVEIEKTVEKIIHRDVPVPYAVEKKVPYPVHYETRIPVPYPVEKRIAVPVERIVEKPVTVTKYVDRPIHIQVPVPQPVPVPVHVPRPYPVDRVVEKKVPYTVEVEKVVEKPVHVPYPVEKIVHKTVEKPVIVTKYINKPYPVEVKVPYPVQKTAEKHIHVPFPYAYTHAEYVSESKNNPTYLLYKDDQAKHDKSLNKGKENPSKEDDQQAIDQRNKEYHPNKLNNLQQIYVSHYNELEKENLKQPVHSTRWGKQYASTYNYLYNNTIIKPNYEKRSNNLATINYLPKSRRSSSYYYGPVPMQNQDDWWQNNKNYVVQVKMRRPDREPKLLRIEYGGFEPPLIPSTQVDLDGMPINKEKDT